ncbi:cytochrome c oxidase assembly factor Coa1 family protein [Pseudoxanthomonas kalamensis]|uniref:cytochrome c oxidase assembly factor Coa1 family protein n=1 Tax=Pseudoxanthomonas kalamensis TaxID=289483 RepID=UPI0013911013|nr:cytochrome c oxidase assembly factor Coa1 family protein [Pseudoxanthomonas kalamensis]
MSTPPPLAPQHPSWWRRHWKWLVPLLAALLLSLFAAFVFGIISLVFGALRSSEPYRHALQRAQADPAVIAALGEPIRAGWFVQGSMSSTGGGGSADLAIPLDGSKADATLYVTAKKSAGRWRYEVVAVNVEDGPRLLLEGGEAKDANTW